MNKLRAPLKKVVYAYTQVLLRKKWIEPVLALLLFSFLYLVYFSPVLLRGHLLAPGDGLVFYVPAFYSGKSFWTQLIFSGFPLLADPQTMGLYPLARLLYLLGDSWNIFVIVGYVIGSGFQFCFVKEITGSRVAGMISGITYGMSGFFMAHLGHTAIIQCAAWLPLILLGVEKLRNGFHAGWFSITCVAVAFSILAGHFQIAVYSLGLVALYVLVMSWRASLSRWRYYSLSSLGVLSGIGIAAIQLLPTLELARHSLRSSVTYEFFTGFSMPPWQLVTLLFPYLLGGSSESAYGIVYFGPWNLTELAGYVGLLPLGLSAIGLGSKRRNLQSWFWGFVAFVSLLLVLGSNTPLAKVVYHIPAYNSFRVPARHFIEFSMAVSVLAGLGISFLQREAEDIRRAWGKRVVMALFVLLSASFVTTAAFQNKIISMALIQRPQWSILPWENPALLIPFMVMLLASVSLMAWCKHPTWRSHIILTFVLILDLGSFGWFYEWHYYSPEKTTLGVPTNVERYREILRPHNQRLISYRGGLGSPEEAMPNLSLLWGVPNVGGYGPLIMSRYSHLLDMQGSGGIQTNSLLSNNRALDVLAARYVMLPKSLFSKKEFPRYEFNWSTQDLNINLAQECEKSANSEISIEVPQVAATQLALVTALGGSTRIPDQTPVLQLTLETTSGEDLSLDLRAGKDTSEWAWDRSDVQKAISHKRANIFESFPAKDQDQRAFEGHRYYTVLPMQGRREVTRIRFRWVGPCGASVSVSKLTLKDTLNNTTFSIDPIADTLADRSRWRNVEEGAQTAVYENLRAMPRAWLASQVLSLRPEEILTSIKNGKLPNGETFDPQNVALVEEAIDFQAKEPDQDRWVKVIKVNDTSIEMVTHSKSDAFLVLSDANYPGWKATVDGDPVQVFQTDYVIRGIKLPAGAHYVRFAMHPLSFYVGAGISGAVLLLLLGLLFRSRLKSKRETKIVERNLVTRECNQRIRS